MRNILAIAVAILLQPTVSIAQSDQVQRDSMITELLDLSGVRRQTDQVPASVRDIFGEMKLDLDRKTTERINKLIDEAYRPDSLNASVVRHLRKNFDRVRIGTLIDWLHTPLPQRIVQLEIQASSPEARYQITRLAGQLKNNPPSESRSRLIRKLDDATGSSEFSVDLATSTFKTLVDALNRIRADDEQIPDVQVTKALANMRKELPAISRTATAVMFLYTYRSLRDAELSEYVDFYSSDNGRWYWRTLSGGLSDAVKSAAARMTKQAASTK